MIKMGYTHYWYIGNRIPKSKWKKIKDDFLKVVKENQWDHTILSTTNEDKLTITDDKILFNGRNENGHEWFVLDRKLSAEQISYQNRVFHSESSVEPCNNFFFCKTALKPYDICVVSCLIIMKKYLGEKIVVQSDGNISDWKEGKTKCQETLGYGDSFEFEQKTFANESSLQLTDTSTKKVFTEAEIMRMANIFTRRVLANGLDFYGKRDKVIMNKIRDMINVNNTKFLKQDRGLGGFDKERRKKWLALDIARINSLWTSEVSQ